MMVDYKRWKVRVTARVLPNGHVAPTLQVMPPRKPGQRRGADALWNDITDEHASSLLFEEEFLSVEEALAKAVEEARKHIDEGPESTGSSHSSAA
jgi:hypothetical protein